MRTLLLACVAVAGMMSFTPKAHAASCWNLSPANFSFGPVSAGQSATSRTTVDFQCNNYDQTAEYVRLCLSLTSTSQPVMNTNPPKTPLYYNLYAADDPDTAVGTGNTTYAEITFSIASYQANTAFPVSLLAKIAPGQTGLAAGDYFDYNTSITAKYDFSQTEQGLPSCKAMAGTVMPDAIAAQATVKNGCELVSVDPMDFGEKTPVDGSQLAGNARSSVVVRCPVGTNYTVSLGMGLHSDGSSRRMCNAGNDCVTYGLYQDAGGAAPWDDKSNILAQTSTTGNDQSIPVYGNIPAQSWPAAGEYDDTVVVTLNY